MRTSTPPSSLHLRSLHPTDLQPYRSLMLHAYASAPDAFTSTPEERALEPDAWWLRRIGDPSGLSIGFGAFVGDTLVGTVTRLSKNPKSTATLTSESDWSFAKAGFWVHR